MFFHQVPSWLNKHGCRRHLLMALSLLLIPDCSSFSPSLFKFSLLAKRERLSLASGPGRARRSVAFTPGVLALRADVTVSLATPLGIIFEEVQPGEAKGLIVAGLVSGGNAERNGKILVGDKLIATSAVILDKSNQPYLSFGGDGGGTTTNWKREMIPCGNLDFNTIMSAIKSNSGRYGYKDVRLTVRRTEQSILRSTETIVREEEEAKENLDLPLKVRPDPWK